MNKVILTGRLTTDPDYRQTSNGIAVCHFTIAVNREYQKGKEQEADFLICQAWRNTAEFVKSCFTKGKPITVEGSVRNNNYTDQNGVKHYSNEILVSYAEFALSDNTQKQNSGHYQQPQQNYQPQQVATSYQPSQNTNYQQSYQQYPQQPKTYQQAPPSQPVQRQKNENFEEILSDGEIPF